MPRLEQVQVTRSKRRAEGPVEQSPVSRRAVGGGGSGPEVDELLVRIDAVLNEATTRHLGRAAGIDPVADTIY